MYATIERQFTTPSATFRYGEVVTITRQRDGYYTVERVDGVVAYDVPPHMLNLR